MTIAIKSLADGLLGSSKATLYTVPTGTATIIKSIMLVNADTSTRTVCFYVKPGAISRRIFPKDLSLLASASFEWEGTITLEAGDLIEGNASVADMVYYVISGVEES